MNANLKKVLTFLSPILGAGAIGVCPLCWIGSASLLTYLGLGALIPAWRWLAFGLITIGAVGFLLDYRAHKNPKPLVLLLTGAILLYVGRYVFASTWGLGGIPPTEPSQFRSDIFKQTPPRIPFLKIKVGSLGTKRLGMVFPRQNPSIFEGERKRPLGNAEVRTNLFEKIPNPFGIFLLSVFFGLVGLF